MLAAEQLNVGLATPNSERAPLVVLIPVYNDWSACSKLLAELNAVFTEQGLAAVVLLVDDGSTVPTEEIFRDWQFSAFIQVGVLKLKRNVGHQRAISLGLAHVEANVPCEAVVVMDGDGEDSPRDIPKLLAQCRTDGNEKIVFAERARRSERFVFRLFYVLYRVLHRILTGQAVRVGNFSVIPYLRLRSLVVVPELWSHYAAAVFTSKLPYSSVPTVRAKRLDGKSSMNFVELVTHGLTAISVFSEVVGVRLLLASSLLAALSLIGIVAVVAVRLMSDLAIPGWATFSAGILLMILVQTILSAIIFSFVILRGRNGAEFLPARDFRFFVDDVRTVCQPRGKGDRHLPSGCRSSFRPLESRVGSAEAEDVSPVSCSRPSTLVPRS
jgi:glycosyltransferase involved in cell wall biosynthesis